MRTLNILNVLIVLMGAFFTWNAVAAPAVKVHVLENLTVEESKMMTQYLSKMGYVESKKSLFAESKNAIIVTKTLRSETEEASMKIEMVHLESDSSIPQTVFQYKIDGNNMQAMLSALPKPEAFADSAVVMPVAYQSN